MDARSFPKLVIESGPEMGLEIELRKADFYIGRAAGLDLVIPHPSISRQHVHLLRQHGQVIVEDLGSTNGVFLNGERLLAPAVLKPQDRLELGQTVCLRYLGPPTAQKTLPVDET